MIMQDKVTPKDLVIVLLVEQCCLLEMFPVYCHRTALCLSEQPSSFHLPLHTARVPSTQLCACFSKDFQNMMEFRVI